MSNFVKMSRRWVMGLAMLGAVVGAAAFLAPSSARADDDTDQILKDGLKKIGDTANCKSRCRREALSCMSRCPNGAAGASCRGSCQIDSSNCSMNCDN